MRRLKKASIFICIGMISGVVLALFLKIVEITTGNIVYYLLFDVSYVPLLNQWKPVWLIELLFHFGTCIISIALLYKLLTFIQMERDLRVYTLVIGAGSAALYFLTYFSDKTPAVTDYYAWFYWIVGHVLFSLTAGIFIKWLIHD